MPHGRDLQAQLFKGEMLAGRETASQGYDARLAQEFGSFLEGVALADQGFVAEYVCPGPP